MAELEEILQKLLVPDNTVIQQVNDKSNCTFTTCFIISDKVRRCDLDDVMHTGYRSTPRGVQEPCYCPSSCDCAWLFSKSSGKIISCGQSPLLINRTV